MRQRNSIAAALLAGSSLLALASQASAQTAPAAAVEEVIVTGSRVIQNGNNMPTPVTIVTADALTQTTPATVMDGLQQLPVFAGGRSPQTNPGNSSQNNAAHQFNLRNIGITRTLVLFDGRRIAPTAPTGEVNADIIPEMLLQRVDVVTGGASAVYGSDAISGVVNFITDKNFNGLKFNAQAGVSQQGDGKEQKFGIAAGKAFMDGRLHVEGSYTWYNNDGIAWTDKLKRSWAQKVWTVQGAGTAANPYHLVQNTRLSSTSFGGYIVATSASQNAGNPLRDMNFTQNGILSNYVHGAATGGNGAESGGDGAYYYQASLVSVLQSNQAFGRVDFDVSDNVKAYGEFTATQTHNLNNHQTNEFRNITLSSSNAFLLPQYQTAMAGAGKSTFVFSKMMQQAPPLQPESYTTAYLFDAGLTGEVNGFKWDLSYVHNENEQDTRNNANIDLGKAYAALDAVKDPASGKIVCNVTLTNPGLYPGCVPLNLFGPTSESADALKYILAVTRFDAKTKMDDFGGSLAGSFFSLPAGPVQMAISGEVRKTTFDLTSNAQASSHLNCTGLRFNCTASTALFISNVVSDAHDLSQTVKEAAYEVDVPILKDAPFAESFNINGAVRYADYDTSGGVTTWKVGGDWHVNSDISFRATRSRDIRAPNLNDLFAPRLINPAGVTDLHTGNTVGQAPFITDSNPNLAPEEADTTTAGVVYRPTWLPRFSVAVDYYKIEIGNAITVIQGQSTTIQKICEDSNGASSFCSLIERPLPFSDHSTANFVTAFYSKPQNAQSVRTHGVDVEANYNLDVGPGNFAVRVLGTYQPELTTIQFPGAPVLNAAGVAGLPTVRISAFLKYAWDNFSVDVQERWHNGTGWNADPTLIYSEPDLPAAAYTSLNLSYKTSTTSYFLAIENLFDKQPHPYGGVGGASGVPGLFGGFVPGDDAIGRYFTVGLKAKY